MSEVSRVSFCPFLCVLVLGWRVAPLWLVTLL